MKTVHFQCLSWVFIDFSRKQIQKRTEAFLLSLDDFEERRRFNNWVNTLGIQLTITDGKRGAMEWDMTKARLYREADYLVMDQVEADAAALGVDLANDLN